MKLDVSSNKSSSIPINLQPMQLNLKKQLRYYLDRKEMTASQLAKKSGVPKQSISGWLAGSNPRDVRQIKLVAEVFHVSIDNLMFGEGTDNTHEKAMELDALLGDGWIGGLFEVRLRRVKK